MIQGIDRAKDKCKTKLYNAEVLDTKQEDESSHCPRDTCNATTDNDEHDSTGRVKT